MKINAQSKCPTVEQLASCLDTVAEAEANVASHLEQCESCRATLCHLAGNGQWWSEAESYLSSASNDAEAMQAEARVSQRVCALTDLQTTTLVDQLTEQESTQLKQLLAPPSHPELMGRINRYELEQLVGRGGMGLVFRAYDTELNRTVAVKILALHLIAIGSARERFVREARAVASLSHPHIVPMYDVVTDGAIPALVMQFIAGETLQHRISRRGSMQVDDVLQIGMQLADALALAHANGLVHRDIKPGNVLLEADGSRALLSDFGLVRALDDATLTHSGMLAGTPDFMSPEQANGHSVDARSDLFSLGSVLYTMLTGHPPFRAPEPMAVLNRICHQPHRSACVVDPRVPIEVSQLLDRMLTKDPKRRIASAEIVRDRLRELARAPRRIASGAVSMLHRVRRVGLFAAVVFGFALGVRTLVPALRDWFESSNRTSVARTAVVQLDSQGAMALETNSETTSNMSETNSEMSAANPFVALVQIDHQLSTLKWEVDAAEQNTLMINTISEVNPFQPIDAELGAIEWRVERVEESVDSMVTKP